MNERLHLADQDLLHLARQHAARAVLVVDALQLRVVLQEVLQVLIRNILRQVCAQRSLLLLRLAAAAVGMAVDLRVSAARRSHLVLDLVGRVGDVNAGVGAGGTHLRVEAHQRRNEFAAHDGWLVLVQPAGDVARHTEVRVLVHGAGDQTPHLLAQHLREGRREGGRRLDRGEGLLADAGGFAEAEDGARLGVMDGRSGNGVDGDALLDAKNISVQFAHVTHVAEDEGLCVMWGVGEDLLGIEAAGNDVLRVLTTHLDAIVQ